MMSPQLLRCKQPTIAPTIAHPLKPLQLLRLENTTIASTIASKPPSKLNYCNKNTTIAFGKDQLLQHHYNYCNQLLQLHRELLTSDQRSQPQTSQLLHVRAPSTACSGTNYCAPTSNIANLFTVLFESYW